MKAEVISSSVVRLTGSCPTRAIVQALEPYSKGSLVWEVPPGKVPAGLVPPALLALAQRAPLAADGAIEVPDDLWEHLFPYQRDGVLRAVHQFKGRCLLADEMGLGKTLQAISCILHYRLPTLVVCPAFLCTNWRRALAEWGAQATVCSYGKVELGEWGMVVVDEAHYLKSRETQRAQTILPLVLAARYALLLTGTPCPNRPEEMYTLLHALRPTLAPDFTARPSARTTRAGRTGPRSSSGCSGVPSRCGASRRMCCRSCPPSCSTCSTSAPTRPAARRWPACAASSTRRWRAAASWRRR